MKRAAAIFAAVLLAAWVVVLAMQLAVGDPETENVTDSDDLPSFYASDRSLLRAGPYRIQERFPGVSDWRSGADTPYFVQLADGRYACGYTDTRGETKPLFTSAKVEHRVFWDDEAWGKWRAARASPLSHSR